MGYLTTPANKAPRLLTTAHTLTRTDLQNYGVLDCATGSVTHTLPTPSKQYADDFHVINNNSNGTVTLSGTFVSGSSATIPTNTSALLFCVATSRSAGATTYKWVLVIAGSGSLSAQTLATMLGTWGTSNPAAYVPTIVWDGDGTGPATPTIVARKAQIGPKLWWFRVSITAADGDGYTPVSISPPAAPNASISMKAPINGRQLVDTTATDPSAYILHSATAGNNLILFDNAVACTNNKAVELEVSGIFEIA